MDNSEDVSENTNKIQQRESFGSKGPSKRSMGPADESPGHLEKEFIKGKEDKGNTRGGTEVLPPFSKAKINLSNLKIEGDV